MRYVQYKTAIENELRRNADGFTWAELQLRLDLPCNRPCPTWTKQLESDIKLQRIKGSGRALIWKIKTRSKLA